MNVCLTRVHLHFNGGFLVKIHISSIPAFYVQFHHNTMFQRQCILRNVVHRHVRSIRKISTCAKKHDGI